MIIRRAVRADAADLTALMLSSRAYQGDYAAILDGYAITAGQIARDEIHLTEDDGTLLGFYSLVRQDGTAELDLMFTADAAQGRGVGRKLFAHMRERAHMLGVTTVRIVAHPPAEGFYLRMGAQRIGEQPARGKVAWTRPLLELAIG